MGVGKVALYTTTILAQNVSQLQASDHKTGHCEVQSTEKPDRTESAEPEWDLPAPGLVQRRTSAARGTQVHPIIGERMSFVVIVSLEF